VNLLAKKELAKTMPAPARLIQIQLVPAVTGSRLSSVGAPQALAAANVEPANLTSEAPSL
jgi:hypothetical protein